MILLIDNYDSFTYNIAQCVSTLGEEVMVRRNNDLTLHDIERLAPAGIIISPGPGRPEDAGISRETVRRFAGRIPILGVCLGHQCIAEVFGGRVRPAHNIMHGKTSRVHHDGSGLFAGIPDGFAAVRYHSLAVDDLPAELRPCASSEDGEIMAMAHADLPLYGLQFHPESVATEYGPELLAAFIHHTGGTA